MSLQSRHHPLQQNALMGSMLINQVHTIRPLSYNIALRQLTNHTQRGQATSWLRRKGLLICVNGFGVGSRRSTAPDPHKGGHYRLVRWRIGLGGPDPHKGGHYRLFRLSSRRCSDPPCGGQAILGICQAFFPALWIGLLLALWVGLFLPLYMTLP